MTAPNRFQLLTSKVQTFSHRELHDIAMHSGVNEKERQAILAAMKAPRKSSPKQTAAVKKNRQRVKPTREEVEA